MADQQSERERDRFFEILKSVLKSTSHIDLARMWLYFDLGYLLSSILEPYFDLMVSQPYGPCEIGLLLCRWVSRSVKEFNQLFHLSASESRLDPEGSQKF